MKILILVLIGVVLFMACAPLSAEESDRYVWKEIEPLPSGERCWERLISRKSAGGSTDKLFHFYCEDGKNEFIIWD